MQVKDVMTQEVDLIDPHLSLAEAARLMRDDDVGALPVGENDRLVGMVTDRDIVVRCVADGKDVTKTEVGDAMSIEVLYCFEDQPVEEIAANMGQNQVRRLPVLNRQKRLVGIVSLGDLATEGTRPAAGEALERISEPSR